MKHFLVFLYMCLTISMSLAIPKKHIHPRIGNHQDITKDNEGETGKKKSAAVAGAVIAGGELALKVLTNILDRIAGYDRKIAIGVDNESGLKWTAVNDYHSSGTSDATLPEEVEHSKALLFSARKSKGPIARGAVGAFAYKLSNGKTLGVLYSVPFDRNLYSNYWNAKIYDGERKADATMYDELYNNNDPIKASEWKNKDLGSGLKMKGYMSNSGEAKLEIHITKS